ncbi:MAG TPA: bile acid:sodium symporter [Vicinamibacterales bacterium]|jgi:BASS family bile acid:Na+ symporter
MELLALVLRLVILGSIFATSLALGLHGSVEDITFIFRRPAKLLKSLLALNVLVPLVAILLVLWLRPAFIVSLAILLMTVAPVPPFLPGGQLKLGGRAPYVYGLLMASALLSIGIVPLSVETVGRIFGRQAGVSPWAVAQTVLLTVLIPVIVGVLIRRVAPAFAERLTPGLAKGAGIVLLIGLIPLLIKMLPGAVALIGNGNVLLIAVVTVAALGIGHLLGGPDPDDRTSLALACGSRHPGVALAIANANFADQQAGGAIVLFIIVSAIASIPYKKWRARHLSMPAASARPA